MKKLDAYRVYMIYSGVMALAYGLSFTVSMYYYVDTVQLNPLQLVLVGTMLEASVFVFEIPTGIVADIYSRRLSIIIGTTLIGFGLALNAIATFASILLAQLVWGFGYTFTSGATAAWITDEIGEDAAGQAFLSSSQVYRSVGLIAIVLSVAAASVTIHSVFLISGAIFLMLTAFLWLFMPETGFTPTPPEDRETWASMKRTFRDGVDMVRRRPVLVNILLISLLIGAFSEGYDRLWTAHLLERFTLPEIGNFEPVVWFGIIRMVGTLIGIGVTEAVRRRVNTSTQRGIVRALLVANGLLLVSLLVFAWSEYFAVTLLAIWAVGAARGLHAPLHTAWTNQGLDSRVRATILSMSGQTDAFGQILGGPMIGVVATTFSLRTALTGSAIILSPVLWLFRISLREEDSHRH